MGIEEPGGGRDGGGKRGGERGLPAVFFWFREDGMCV